MSYNLILASSLLNWKSFLSILKNKHTSILCKNFWQNAMATLDKKSCVFVPSSIVKTGKKISINYIRIKIWLIFFWWVNFWWCQFLTLWCFLFIAFACNAKSFAIAFIFYLILLFFFHFVVLAVFGRTDKKIFFWEYFIIRYPESLWPGSVKSPWTQWQIFCWWSVYYSIRVWPLKWHVL